MVADFIARGQGWPDPKMIQTRVEESLARERPSPDLVISALAGKAISGSGVRLLGKAYLAKGDTAAARQTVRAAWHNRGLGVTLQGAYTDDFGSILSVDDHLSRVDYLIGEGLVAEAKGLRSRLGTGPRAYMDARIAAAEGASGANALLQRVPAEYRKRPGYSLAMAETLRRADDLTGAAKLLSRVSPRTVVNGDAWWVESRIVARSLAEKGDWRSAYALASIGFAETNENKADEAFHAGWFALTGLKDGARRRAPLRGAGGDRHHAALAVACGLLAREGRGPARRPRRFEAPDGDRGPLRLHLLRPARADRTRPQRHRRQHTAQAHRQRHCGNEGEPARRRHAAPCGVRPRPPDLAVPEDSGRNREDAGAGDARRQPRARCRLPAPCADDRQGSAAGGRRRRPARLPDAAHPPLGARSRQGSTARVVYSIARQELQFNSGAREPGGRGGSDAGDAAHRGLRRQGARPQAQPGQAHERSRLQRDARRSVSPEAPRQLRRLVHPHLRRLQRGRGPGERVDRALRRPARPPRRPDHLGRADPVPRDAQLRAAGDGERSGLPRGARHRASSPSPPTCSGGGRADTTRPDRDGQRWREPVRRGARAVVGPVPGHLPAGADPQRA